MRLIKHICLAIALILTIVSCARQEKKLTIVLGGAPSEVKYLESLIGDFSRKSGTEVSVIRQPTDSDQRRQGLLIPLKAGEADPDVFLMDVVWVGQFAASGWLLPLQEYMKEDGFDSSIFFSSVFDRADTFRGAVVALPVYVDTGIMFYRKDILDKYGLDLPANWLGLIDIARKVQEKERSSNGAFYGYVWQGAQYEGLVCNFIEISSAYGGCIINENGKVSLKSPENIAALEQMIALISDNGISPPNTFTEMKEEESRIFFQNGNALFERNWPYAWRLHESDGSPVKGKTGIMPLPVGPSGHRASALGGWHVGISRSSDLPEEAWELVKFLVSREVQRSLCLELGWNPGRKDLYEDPDIAARIPHIAVLKTAFESSVARPSAPFYTHISEIVQKYINAALSRNMTAQEALSAAQKEVERIMTLYNE